MKQSGWRQRARCWTQLAMSNWPPEGKTKDRLMASVEQLDAKAKQIGGDHYSKLAIQPMEYSLANGLDPAQHTVIKYVTRFRDKNGVEDLRKAIHTLELLIEWEGRKA